MINRLSLVENLSTNSDAFSFRSLIICRLFLSLVMVRHSRQPWTRRVVGMVEDFVNYSQLKYNNLESLRTLSTPKAAFRLSDLHINVRDLWRALHSGDFSAIPLYDVLFGDRKLIYAFVNSSHRKLYIGQTNDMRVRYHSHFKESFAHKHKHKKTDRFHSFVAWNNLGSWMMVPIFLPINSIDETNRVEKRIIRSFGDSTLNSQHVLLRNRFVLGPKYNNKRSSPAHIWHSRHRHSSWKVSTQVSHAPMRFQLLEHKRFFGENTYVHHSFCYDLRRLLNLQIIKSCHLYKSMHMVRVVGADTTTINWNALRMQFGDSVVSIDGSRLTTLRYALKMVKQGLINQFYFVKRNLWDDHKAYQVITKLGNASKRVAKRVCKYVSFENMLSLRKLVNSVCHHSRSKENATGHLDFWLRKRFSFSSNPH